MENNKIQCFKDLKAWQAGHRLVIAVYKITRGFPRDQLNLTHRLLCGLISKTRSFISLKSNLYSLISILFFITLYSPISVQASTISKPANFLTINTGLVGWWTFDGPDMKNNVKDKSGSGNNGSMIGFGATSTAVVKGKLGQALKFDGVDDYVQLPTNFFGGKSAVTVAFWIKVPTFSQGTYIGGTVTDLSTGYGTTFGVTNSYQGYTKTFSGAIKRADGDCVVGTVKQSNFKTNTWYHYVAVYDGTQTGNANRFKIYLNATQYTLIFDEQEGNVPSSIYNSGFNSTIGHSANAVGNYSNGPLDDVRVYNRALSATEIRHLYNLGGDKIATSPKITKTTSCTTGLSCGLVGYWTFDGKDTNWNTKKTNDLSGNGKTGTITNMSTSSAPVAGKLGQGLKFNGREQNVYASITGILTLSYSLWMNAADVGDTNQFIISQSVGGQNAQHFLRFKTSDNKVYLGGNTVGGAVDVISATINTKQWVHVVAEIDWVASSSALYINGILSATGASPTRFQDFNNVLVIGEGPYSVGVYDFNGSMDDVRVYSRALTATEIRQLYNQGGTKFATSQKVMASTTAACSGGLSCGLVGYWTFDGKDTNWNTNKTNDLSGLGNTGTMTNMSTSSAPVSGKIGQGLKFDGVDDRVLTTFNPNNILGNTGSFTISFWVYPTCAVNVSNKWFSASDAGDTRFYFGTSGNLSNELKLALGSWQPSISAGFVTNQWQQYTVVLNGTSGSVYKNSILLTSTTGITVNNPNANLTIGSYVNNSSNTQGKMDDVRVYNRALSANEIEQLYNLGK